MFEMRSLTTGAGLDWIACGWGLFKRDWAAWIGMLVVAALLAVGLSLVPLLGPLLLTLGLPALSAGAAYACSRAESGGPVRVTHLFAGFSDTAPRARLLTLGAILLAAQVALLLATLALVGAGMFVAEGLGEAAHRQADMLGVGALIGLLLLLTLSLVLVMLFYFAAPLVMLRDLTPTEALRVSLAACLKNVLPLLVFQLVLAVLAFLAALPVGLGLIVLLPVMVCGHYCSFVGIFPSAAGEVRS